MLTILSHLVPIAHAATKVTVNFGGGAGSCGGGASTLCSLGETLLSIINNILVPVIFALAFIVFLWGVASAFIFSGGDPERVSQGRTLILWGIIGFVVMLSIWGLVNLVASSVGISGSSAPALPQSY